MRCPMHGAPCVVVATLCGQCRIDCACMVGCRFWWHSCRFARENATRITDNIVSSAYTDMLDKTEAVLRESKLAAKERMR